LKSFILKNSKGISVLFLLIVMMLMVTIGYIFSYLIPTKQKSVVFSISSSQAFYAAQSGVEYAIRYSSDQGWSSATDLLGLNSPGINQRDIGKGRFTINYDNGADILTSTGEIINASMKRIVSVSSFTQFLRLIFEPDSPPHAGVSALGGPDSSLRMWE